MVFTGAFSGDEPQKHCLANGPVSYIRIVPAGWNADAPNSITYLNLQSSEKPACPSNGMSSGSWGGMSDGAAHFWFRGVNDPEQRILSITKFFEETGEVWACRVAHVHNQCVAWRPMLRHWYDVLRSTHTFLDAHGAKPARYVELGFSGLSGLSQPGQFSHDRILFRKGEMKLHREAQTWDDPQMDQLLLDALNEIFNNLLLEPTDMDGLRSVLTS